MTENGNSSSLTREQLQNILDTERIRRHLIKAGLINDRGEIIPEDKHQRRPKRRRNILTQSYHREMKYPTFTRRPLISSSPRRRLETNGSLHRSPPRPSNPLANEHRQKSASTAQSKQTNNASTSTRLSSSNQFTCEQNVLLRRAVSPKIIAAGERCLVGIKYFGPEVNIEYDREWFEPNGDEILIMQQHCGGENLLVYKGGIKPDETFLFESRRHTDYPFALAFYINGVIENRLSICCESRCNNMRIGGKHGLFAIVSLERAKACRRCRFEQRMIELKEIEEKKKNAAKAEQTSVSPAKPVPFQRPDSNSNAKPVDAPRSTTESKEKHPVDRPPSIAKLSEKHPPDSNGDRLKSPSSDPLFIRRSPPEPTRAHTPSPLSSVTNSSTSNQHQDRSPPSGSAAAHRDNGKPVRNVTPDPLPDNNRSPTFNQKQDRPAQLESAGAHHEEQKPVRNITSGPLPSVTHSPTFNQHQDRPTHPDSVAAHQENGKPVRNVTPDPLPSIDRSPTFNQKQDRHATPSPQLNRPNLVRDSVIAASTLRSVPNGQRRPSRESLEKRVSSDASISSDISSSESLTPRRKSTSDRPLSSPPVKLRSKFKLKPQAKESTEKQRYTSDFDDSSESIPSSISSPRDIPPAPRNNGLEKKANDRPSVSSIDTEENEIEEDIPKLAEAPKNVSKTFGNQVLKKIERHSD